MGKDVRDKYFAVPHSASCLSPVCLPARAWVQYSKTRAMPITIRCLSDLQEAPKSSGRVCRRPQCLGGLLEAERERGAAFTVPGHIRVFENL